MYDFAKLYEDQKFTRPSRDVTGIQVAKAWAERSTCPLRKVGCLLVDKNFRTLATGYNGNPPGHKHCIDSPCEALICENQIERQNCAAIHAEANALMYCSDVERIHTCYTTTSPCRYCIKMLLGTSCIKIVFETLYIDATPERLWKEAGREWLQVQI